MLIFPPVAFRAIWLIPGLFLMTLMMDPGGNVSHVGHLGGVLVGWLYLRRSGPRGRRRSRSRSSSTAGAATGCASACAPSGTTSSRRGAAATTTGPCTGAMSDPTPSPDFAIPPALGGADRARGRAGRRSQQRGGADRSRPLGRERDPALPRAGRPVDEVRRAAARRLPALPARSQEGLAGPPLAARALGAGARRDARLGQAQRRPPRARRAGGASAAATPSSPRTSTTCTASPAPAA